jgi:hypothetical protein
MEAGANEQARPWGSPAQVKAIALLNVPDVGVAVTVTLPDPPEEIVKEEGSVPSVRFVPPVVPATQLEMNCTGPEIWLVMLGFPTACTNSV